MRDLFRGTLVRLANELPDEMAKTFTRWDRDSEYHRLADSDPAQLWSAKKHREWIEKRDEFKNAPFRFSIRTLEGDRLIGYAGIHPIWEHSDAWIGIAIGEREYWGKGYGSDAMRLIVQFGFLELNLKRVSLALHSYNERALKAYQKVGFRLEGAVRQDILRDGRRTNSLFMGLLRQEWWNFQGQVE
jgi:RimJ/RimL family protein N-acetyltransferase